MSGKMERFSLKKSRILKLLNVNEQEKEKILDFVETNKLSFKKEEDIKKIIEYDFSE